MTDIRVTQNYETIAGSGEGDVRVTENYETLLGENADADIRQTQAYAFMLGNTPTPEFRNTQSYFQTLQEGVDELRNTFTYFQMLGIVEPLEFCAFLSFVDGGPRPLILGPYNNPGAYGSSMDPGPVAFQSSLGNKVQFS